MILYLLRGNIICNLAWAHQLQFEKYLSIFCTFYSIYILWNWNLIAQNYALLSCFWTKNFILYMMKLRVFLVYNHICRCIAISTNYQIRKITKQIVWQTSYLWSFMFEHLYDVLDCTWICYAFLPIYGM